MSEEKTQAEARRWLTQARADLAAARSSVASQHFEWASFQAQQAGEKALKALYYHHALDPWGHSLAQLILGMPRAEIRQALQALVDPAKALDKLYIPTRYPNGLPALTPAEVFTKNEAEQAIERAHQIIESASELMKS